MIPSISYNQHDIIRWITELHLGGQRIDLDPTYSKGQFYKPDDIEQPDERSDLHPQDELTNEWDCRSLPHADGVLDSIMFDPPFLVRAGKNSRMKARFGGFDSIEEAWQMYEEAIIEFARILKSKGILIIKMQNLVNSGRQHWSVDQVNGAANRDGFTKLDEFILLAKNRMEQPGKYTQRHARKFHSYFLVFKKD